MNRPLPALISSVALLACLTSGCGESQPEHKPARNVLLITVDTLRADRLGIYGGAPGTSPSIDALGGSGVVFENAMSHSSWTLPSIASLITSTYPSTHKVIDYKSGLDDSFVTLAELLQDAGFATGAVTSHVFVGPRHGMHQGIAAFDDRLVADGAQMENRITSQAVSARGVEWLRDAAGRQGRWFLWLHYFDPHFPYLKHDDVPTSGADEEALYAGEITYTDRFVGQVLDELRTLGIADETVVALISDHGEEFRDHDKLRHGFTLFREVARVPLVIRAPGVTPRRISPAVRNVDVMPTVLDLLGLPVPPAIEGDSLVRMMTGGPDEQREVLGELRLHPGYHSDSMQFGRWKLVVDQSGTSMVGYADREGGPPRKRSNSPIPPAVTQKPVDLLFNLDDDPSEQTDVSAAHPEVVARLRALLNKAQERARKLAESGGYAARDSIDYTAEELEHMRQLGYIR